MSDLALPLDLFPGTVRVATGPSASRAVLAPEEQALADAMGEARRREFAAGRDCARRAMHALGVPGGPVLRGTRRAPRWPEGVVGAITHTRGFCAAAVARPRDVAGLGLDAERWRPLSDGVVGRICHPEETVALGALPHHELALWATALFSAKESLYKGYFPLTQTFIGFRDATVRLHPDARDHGRFEARLVRDDVPDAAGRRSFEGRFRVLETEGATVVVTGLVVPPGSAGY